ncbi:MAG TPA: TonB-dependent receptor [Bacteroidales bacterium]|nr:TonB-dependent receptor [Bacteroidales bacterium]HRX96278.1 TonB-dependent receptor [Bacteroidales bacterium]
MVKRLSSKVLLILSFILFGYVAGYAQSGTVSGTVTDAAEGEPLPGVTVLIKGTTLGTATDMDGKYSLSVEPNATLVFSYVGFESQEIAVQPNSTVNVSLKMSAEYIDEFVVIGYGVAKKDDATGSVIAVDSKEFNRGAITSPTELVSGKIAGVQITNNGGAPGEGSTIRIRGGSSLSASNDPLFVIDGVPVDDGGVSGMRNPLNTINPNDIETFTVLKDASATAIYGSRASNGVIIITTKKGQKKLDGVKGLPVKFEYNGNLSIYTVPKTIDVYGGQEFQSLIEERYPNQTDLLGYTVGGEKMYADTDWQDEIYEKSAFGMDHYLSASGVTGKLGPITTLPYRISFGYTDQDGVLKTDNIKRTTIAGNLNPSMFDDHLNINLNGKYVNVDNFFANRDAIGAALQYDPTKPATAGGVFEERYGGYWAWLQDGSVNPVEQGSANPVALLNQREDKSNVNRFIGNAQLDYKFHFLPELRANLNLGYDRSKSEGTIFVDTTAAFAYDPQTGGGTNNYYEQEKKNELLDFYLNYVKNIDGINSVIDVMAGYSWQHFYYSNYSINSDVLLNPERTDTIDDPTEYYLVSFFGRLNYTYNNKYLLTFTLRNDNTSRFSEDTRAGWFPSVAFGWKIKEESFLADVNSVSQLKLRLGWGITGQQNIGQGNYPYLPRYTTSNQFAQYQLGNLFYYTLRPEGYDADIKWEETTTWNVGLDYGFAKDRIYGSIDYYYRQTNDLINFIPVPAGTNLTNYILTNIGDLENRGVEFSIIGRAIAKDDMFWEVGFNATYNKNEITKLTATDDPDYLGVEAGGISGGVGNNIQMHTVGHPAYSYFVFEQVYDANGKPIQGLYVDRNGDGQITNDDRYHYKDPAADFYFGISSRFNYKNWDFMFSGRANFGNYVYDNVNSENAVYERLYRPEGPYLSNVVTAVSETGFQNPEYLSDYYIKEASFFKMDVITLGYTFANLANDRVKLRLSATVNNAFTITQYEGIDPEISGGIDNRIYPRPRVYSFGLNLQF